MLAVTCTVPGCDYEAACVIGRWPVCSGHEAAARASVKVAAKTTAVALAPRLLKRFPRLATAARLVDSIRREREAALATQTAEGDVEEAEVIEATVIRTHTIPKERS